MVASRVLPAHEFVFPAPGEIRFFDTDPYYHLRYTQNAAEDFPKLLRIDRSQYPHGARALYAGLFDVVTAGAALVVSGFDPKEEIVARVAAWTPVVMGLLCLGCVFWLAALCAGPWAGALAAIFLTVYPGTFMQRSLLGAFDHHIAEVLLALLLTIGIVRTLQREHDGSGSRWWRPAFGAALPLALLLFTWYGGPLHVVLAGATFLAQATFALVRGQPASYVGRAAFRFATAALLLTGAAALAAPWLVMQQGKLLAALGALAVLGAGMPAYVFALERGFAPGARRRAAGAVAPFVVVGIVVAAMRLSGDVADVIDQILGEKTTLVTEQFEISVQQFFASGGAPAVLGLLAVPLVAIDAWRRPSIAPRLAAVVYGALLVGLWLQTRDYNYVAGPSFAVMGAVTVATVGRWIASRPARVAGALVLAAAVAIPVPWIPIGAAPWPGRRILDTILIVNEGWIEALRWLRQSSAPLAVPIDKPLEAGEVAHPPGNYGVVNNWTFGHFIATVGKRPPVAAGGHHRSNTRWLLLEDEPTALQKLDELAAGGEIRYVVVDPHSAGPYFGTMVKQVGGAVKDYMTTIPARGKDGEPLRLLRYGDRYRRTMVVRLYVDDGDGLGHFRMVYATRPKVAVVNVGNPPARPTSVRKHVTPVLTPSSEAMWKKMMRTGEAVVGDAGLIYEPIVEPQVKIFERVRGARLAGSAPPGSAVEATLSLRAQAGRHLFVYHRSAVAGPDGRFELVVPYATEPDATTDVVSTAPYSVKIAGREPLLLSVPARAVLDGTVVEVPAS
jgi:dolichyl-diphosphooligosaccharide--protein glycosyltransferase